MDRSLLELLLVGARQPTSGRRCAGSRIPWWVGPKTRKGAFGCLPWDRRRRRGAGRLCALAAGTFRKGTSILYVAHLLGVCALALEDGGTEDEAIAALLHDAVEDAGGKERLRAIRARFGEKVAGIVAGCSDTDLDPKLRWRGRKEAYLHHLKTEADASMLRVSLADKLHNARTILRDQRAMGEAIWVRFDSSAADQLWYFESLVAVFRQRSLGSMTDDLSEVVAEIRERHEERLRSGSS